MGNTWDIDGMWMGCCWKFQLVDGWAMNWPWTSMLNWDQLGFKQNNSNRQTLWNINEENKTTNIVAMKTVMRPNGRNNTNYLKLCGNMQRWISRSTMPKNKRNSKQQELPPIIWCYLNIILGAMQLWYDQGGNHSIKQSDTDVLTVHFDWGNIKRPLTRIPTVIQHLTGAVEKPPPNRIIMAPLSSQSLQKWPESPLNFKWISRNMEYLSI